MMTLALFIAEHGHKITWNRITAKGLSLFSLALFAAVAVGLYFDVSDKRLRAMLSVLAVSLILGAVNMQMGPRRI